jgi:hypothetical protein
VNFIHTALLALLLPPCVIGQTSIAVSTGQTTTTITEPAVSDIPGLFRLADTVAVVKIVSGDTEHYKVAVYKGEVVQAFKGVANGETLFFGPYVGLKLGSEYVLFILATTDRLEPVAATASYGSVRYHRIFNEGYTAMETSYQCLFKGKSVNEGCDYAVRVCTDYVKTPKTLTVAPPLQEDTPFGCRWARQKQFIAILQNLAAAKP